jgi:histidine triad (HIT) family protein
MEPQLEDIKQQCIFCQIISGKIPGRLVYQDEYSYAILDINPATPGHILLLTKEHYAIMPQIPEHVIGHLGQLTKALSKALIRALQVEGTTTFIANGVAGGQRAQHFMIHIIPQGQGFSLNIPKKEMSTADQEKIRGLIVPVIENVIGFRAENKLEEPVENKDEPKRDGENVADDRADDRRKGTEDEDVPMEEDADDTSESGSLDSLTDFLTK